MPWMRRHFYNDSIDFFGKEGSNMKKHFTSKTLVLALGLLLGGTLLLSSCTTGGDSPGQSESEPQPEQATPIFDEAGRELAAGEILLPISEASFTEGEGLAVANEKVPTAINADSGLLEALAVGAQITYVVPEQADGSYDIYLRVSRILADFCSTPFTIAINNSAAIAVPLPLELAADSPVAKNGDGKGSWTDSGLYLMQSNKPLVVGDVITITAAHGSRAASLKGVAFPAVGSIVLAPAGSDVGVGYDAVVPVVEQPDPSDPLSGLEIIWLGSSVTYGTHSGGYTMADAIADSHAATISYKYGMASTTLVNGNADSYVARLMEIDPAMTPDMVIVQLSTNDATTGKEFGVISGSFALEDFDDGTIYGAIETILAYVKQTFGCPTLFYTGTYYDNDGYAQMVDALMQIQEKWDIGVIDLYHNKEMTAMYQTEQYDAYMFDNIHPNREGYVEWWTPEFEAYLTQYITDLED